MPARIARVLAVMACIWLIDQRIELIAAAPSRPPIREFSSDITLRGQTLTLHVAIPSAPVPPGTPLVLYASGDGGWFGAAVSMFRTLAQRLSRRWHQHAVVHAHRTKEVGASHRRRSG